MAYDRVSINRHPNFASFHQSLLLSSPPLFLPCSLLLPSLSLRKMDARGAAVIQPRARGHWPKLTTLTGMTHHVEVLRTSLERGSDDILLYGPTGCGKTTLAHAIANDIEKPFYETSATGITPREIQHVFTQASRAAIPSIIFIDDLDDLALSDVRTDMLLSCMVEARFGMLTVIGAVQQPLLLDQRLKNRFNSRIHVNLPDMAARTEMVPSLLANLEDQGFDLSSYYGKINPEDVALHTEGKSVTELQDFLTTLVLRRQQKT